MNKKNLTTIYITDEAIAIYAYDRMGKTKDKYAYQELEPGIIELGYIKKPIVFLTIFSKTIKRLGKIPNQVQWIIQDQNLLIRELRIHPSDIENSSIDKYISKELHTSIHYPYNKICYQYEIKEQNSELIKLIMQVCDDQLIQSYLDIFEKVGVFNIEYNMMSNVINTTYNESNKNAILAVMQKHSVTLSIIENNITIFSTIYECHADKFDQNRLETYIEIVSNYYQYNLRKNQKSIDKIYIMETALDRDLGQELKAFSKVLTHYEIELISTHDINKKHKDAGALVGVTYIATIAYYLNNYKSLKLNVNRINRMMTTMYYAFSSAIFALLALMIVVIPWMNATNSIDVQRDINDAFNNQLETFRDSLDIETFTSDEITYNNVYERLNELDQSQIALVDDLLEIDTANISFLSLQIDEENNQITFKIEGVTRLSLYEYVDDIYNAYIYDEDTASGFILDYPEFEFLSDTVMEVVINYV